MMITRLVFPLIFLLLLPPLSPWEGDATAQAPRVSSAVKLVRLKYSGGGDWYNDPQEEVNLLKYLRSNTPIDVDPVYEFVEATSEKFFSYPLIFLTGHGNISFSEAEVQRIRTYLQNGGFIYADDDYGMDGALRRELKKIFPAQDLAELPFSHGIYRSFYTFPDGPPKTHEHDGKTPQGFGLFHNGRLVLYYTYESNPSDGWNDPEVHGTPRGKRDEAFRFGTNIIAWALTNYAPGRTRHTDTNEYTPIVIRRGCPPAPQGREKTTPLRPLRWPPGGALALCGPGRAGRGI